MERRKLIPRDVSAGPKENVRVGIEYEDYVGLQREGLEGDGHQRALCGVAGGSRHHEDARGHEAKGIGDTGPEE